MEAPPIASSVIVVHHAETGRSFHIPAAGTAAAALSVGALQAALEPATGISYKHQILLLEGLKLEEDRVLGEYGLPDVNRPVFLFSRRSLSRNASPPERQAVPPFDLELPMDLTAAQLAAE